MDYVQDVYDMFVGLLRGGNTPEQGEGVLRGLIADQGLVRAAVSRYRSIAENLISAREPDTLADKSRLIPWYTGARPGDVFWPALRDQLAADGFDQEALQSVDLASTKVVAHLPPPWLSEFSGRGLVLGYVQSGKTSNFTAVASKAADAGYRLVIVMSGIHNNLRRQTQLRLEDQLVGLNPSRWMKLTSDTADFGIPDNADALLSQNSLRILAVVKKHKRRLQNLIDWLNSASSAARRNCPILVIDDEADQASVNTRYPEDRAVINGLIIELLSQPKIAYVGYTATPFANIFIDPSIPEDLYPRDFIVDLPRPADYFGPERLFGREPLTEEEYETGDGMEGLDVVRYVSEDEVRDLRPPRKKSERGVWDPCITSALRDALRYFLLATAARRARGHTGKHSSMLIHTTQFAELHGRYRGPLMGEVALVRELLSAAETDPLQELWEHETTRVPAESVGESSVSFADLVPQLPSVLDDVKVIVDNYLSDERLSYGTTPQVVIAIGGNTLSRGLTLEGLVVSFFLRSTVAYDTLLQMGRWFGYRGGYADLPRIWTTPELAEYFQFLATVEAEIRIDVARYEREDVTPVEFGLRVRTHPKLAITSALKMRAVADCQVSYSGRRLQTILFEHRDSGWLRGNQDAARALIAAAGGDSGADIGRGRYLYEGVAVEHVELFLTSYEFHPDAQDLVSSRILQYIHGQVRNGELLVWNVGIVGRQDLAWGEFDLGTGSERPVGLINRAAIQAVAKPHANIKSLMSHEDRVLDLGFPPDEVKRMTDDQLQSRRPSGIGLVILYPINKDSVPQRRVGNRVALNAVEHMVGVGLVFPEAKKADTKVSYKSVLLPLGDIDEIDDVDPSDMDTEADLNDVSL
ncbi:MAG: hypothetical protein QOG43_1233 [Actinomycetota bacterium]|jgi:hypothetical protein|nr:hypothetical protein [Actinomycetota bacterium]